MLRKAEMVTSQIRQAPGPSSELEHEEGDIIGSFVLDEDEEVCFMFPEARADLSPKIFEACQRSCLCPTLSLCGISSLVLSLRFPQASPAAPADNAELSAAGLDRFVQRVLHIEWRGMVLRTKELDMFANI